MARPKKTAKIEETLEEVNSPLPLEEWPLESLRDYRKYNEEARRLNKQLGTCRYKIKQCPVELHPTERIVFGRVDQPSNPLPVFVSNEHIEFKETLIPGQTYDLPKVIVSYLADKGVPVWDWVEKKDGSRETYMSHKTPRFTLRTVYGN